MKIYSKYNAPAERSACKWSSDLPSQAVPDQSLTVRDLLERFTTGLLSPQAVWHEDIGDDVSDLDNPNPADAPDFDLTDRDAIRQAAQDAKETAERLRRRKDEQRTKEPATREQRKSDDKQEPPAEPAKE